MVQINDFRTHHDQNMVFNTHYDQYMVRESRNCAQNDDFDTHYDCHCDQDDDQNNTIHDVGTHCDQNCDRDDDQDHTIKHLNYDIISTMFSNSSNCVRDDDSNNDDISTQQRFTKLMLSLIDHHMIHPIIFVMSILMLPIISRKVIIVSEMMILKFSMIKIWSQSMTLVLLMIEI